MSSVPPSAGSAGQRNRYLVLDCLRTNGAKPRSEIAACINVAKAAITVTISEMLSDGILEEKEGLGRGEPYHRGRRKVPVDINVNYKLVFGVTIEEDAIHIGLTNLGCETLDRMKVSLPKGEYRGILEAIVAGVSDLMKKNCIFLDKILGIGVCISKSGEKYIEGSSLPDKLTRVRKDLSHATTVKIVTAPTAAGAVSVQKLCDRSTPKNILLLRYGRQIESSVTVNGSFYSGASGNAGGFAAMQYSVDGMDSFRRYEGEAGMEDGSACRLNAGLASDIELCYRVLDPDGIYLYGSYFELPSALEEMNRLLSVHPSAEGILLHRSCISEDTVYLAGNAAAIERCFYQNEF